MSVARCQREVSSAEFGEWFAYYMIEAEAQQGDEQEPTQEELGGKIAAWAAMHNTRVKK